MALVVRWYIMGGTPPHACFPSKAQCLGEGAADTCKPHVSTSFLMFSRQAAHEVVDGRATQIVPNGNTKLRI